MEMNDETVIHKIVRTFGLNLSEFLVERIDTGHIHLTYKLNGKPSYILQRVNKDVFKRPEIISSNLRLASDYLTKNFPHYLFLRCIPTVDKTDTVYDTKGFPWRLFHYLENTNTLDKVDTPEEAFSAASEFGRLTCFLDKIAINKFKETIPQFHDLTLRYRQFEEALAQSTDDRREL